MTIEEFTTKVNDQLQHTQFQHSPENDAFVLGYVEALTFVLSLLKKEFHVNPPVLERSLYKPRLSQYIISQQPQNS